MVGRKVGLAPIADTRFNLAFINFVIAMSQHLKLLQEMFPDKILLNYHDISKIFNVSHKSVFRLLAQNIITVKIVGNGKCKIQVSILKMARYLDAQVESVVNEVREPTQKSVDNEVEKPPAQKIPIKRKSGRPRYVPD